MQQVYRWVCHHGAEPEICTEHLMASLTEAAFSTEYINCGVIASKQTIVYQLGFLVKKCHRAVKYGIQHDKVSSATFQP